MPIQPDSPSAASEGRASKAAAGRLLIVSNRLPVTVSLQGGEVRLRRSAGGLATGLAGPHERSGGLWLGWPGDLTDFTPEQREEMSRQLERMRVVPIELSREEVKRYYDRYANGVVWPLFHYLLESLPLAADDYGAYERVNQRFADVVAEHYRPGDLVWVHDYQLMRVPALLRRKIPDARIGFFLHIPFPSSEVFRTLPQRVATLEGLLGADLVGFHTAAYLRHFASAMLRHLGVAVDVDRVRWQGRDVQLGVFPMGIDAAAYAALGDHPDVEANARTLRGEGGIKLLVGIDRLDYTKGIPRRLLAFEHLLATHPELRERVRLIQVAVPSRTDVEAYERFRRNVDRLVGRINGAFATPRWVPVHYMFRALSQHEIVSLYRAADVMVVTPVRDGMNLVAKEFCAARTDGDGVLVLSELAGAASELAEAIQVNPYDIERSAEALRRALTMPAEERRVRIEGLRRRVMGHDVQRWVDSFLETLRRTAAQAVEPAPNELTPPEELDALVKQVRAAHHLVLLLDYDGTLVPFHETPELAMPDAELTGLLRRLVARPRTEVHVVSGRSHEILARWLGDLGLGLHAEHGLWTRPHGSSEWQRLDTRPLPWRDRVRAILEQFAARTPGSLVEEKGAGLAFHYRAADEIFGQKQANELRLHLTELLSNLPVEILTGSKVVEVRPHGVNKGRIVGRVLRSAPEGALVVAIGDDRTDEDMFAALPPEGIAVHVGPEPTRARIRIGTVPDTRALLARFCEAAPEPG